MRNKMLFKDKLFGKILCLPILNACIADDKGKSGLKKEIDADSFAKKMGYRADLTNILKKMTRTNPEAVNANDSKDKNMKDLIQFSNETMDQLRQRQENLAKRNLLTLKKECASPYIAEYLDNYYNTIFQENEHIREKILERAVDLGTDEMIIEKFLFGPKTLAKIDINEIDYIEVKLSQIQTELDKMMLISYTNSKIDIVDYYISIVEDPVLSKKYVVPHTMTQLKNFKNRLEKLRSAILAYKIPMRQRGVLVQWPTGYEG